MSLVIAAPATPTVAVAGGGDFPVHRIYCVGRNYAAHAREMGHDPKREEPFFFMKPADAVVANGATLPYPSRTSNLHHEIELVVALKGGGSDVPAAKALDLVLGYGVGVDLTRRDLQDVAKKMARPWDLSKGFDRSAPCAPISPAAKVGHPSKGAIWLKINGTDRQTGDLADMIWNVPDTIAFLSTFVALSPGDLIFTGTPEGVGPVARGDKLHGHVDGLVDLTFSVA
jgi:fumarylpyruvate hydrolase